MSFTFTAISLGIMIGSLVCGIVYDKIPVTLRELAFSIAIVLNGALMGSAPFIGQLGGLPAFITMATLWTIPRGFFAACRLTIIQLCVEVSAVGSYWLSGLHKRPDGWQ